MDYLIHFNKVTQIRINHNLKQKMNIDIFSGIFLWVEQSGFLIPPTLRQVDREIPCVIFNGK